MSNNTAKEQAYTDQLSQDALLRKIEREYTTSAAAPDTAMIEGDQFIEDTTFTPLSIVETAINSDTEEKDSEEKLHFRNQAQAEHTVSSERSAIAYWAK